MAAAWIGRVIGKLGHWVKAAWAWLEHFRAQEEDHWREQIGDTPREASDGGAACGTAEGPRPLEELVAERQRERGVDDGGDGGMPSLAELAAERNRERGNGSSGDGDGGS